MTSAGSPAFEAGSHWIDKRVVGPVAYVVEFRMRMSEVLTELVSRDTRGEEIITGTEDIERWTAWTRLDYDAFLDGLAMELATRYDQGRLPFGTCDEIVNWFHGHHTATLDTALPEVFLDVFEAFDEGEYYHGGDASEDPEKAYTRPMIQEVLARGDTREFSSAPNSDASYAAPDHRA
ncbi:hypothetical protein ABZ777_12130 [Micromonospora parva]|uniref:hypothetical protein n=1 Tax=Micromonospora parva TaxID=1464048 RepID=UPI0033D24BC0